MRPAGPTPAAACRAAFSSATCIIVLSLPQDGLPIHLPALRGNATDCGAGWKHLILLKMLCRSALMIVSSSQLRAISLHASSTCLSVSLSKLPNCPLIS